MGASEKAIFAFQFLKPVLKAITHLIHPTVLEIQFWSVKCTTVTAQEISITSNQVMHAITRVRPYENKPLQNAFKHICILF